MRDGAKGREAGRDVAPCRNVLRRGRYPDTLPISSRTSESRSDRRPNPRVILSNPKGSTMRISANRQSIPNVSTNSGPANGDLSTSNGRIYSPNRAS